MNQRTAQQVSNIASPRRGLMRNYVVSCDYDKTPDNLLPLDYYLLDKDISYLVKLLFTDVQNWSRWAIDNTFDAVCYFSPTFANRPEPLLLGYGISER